MTWLQASADHGNECAASLLQHIQEYRQAHAISAAFGLLGSLAKLLRDDAEQNFQKRQSMDPQKLCRKLMDKGRVERIEAEKQPKGLSAKTIRNIMQIISSAMDFAVAQKIITENPCKAVELPTVEKQEM